MKHALQARLNRPPRLIQSVKRGVALLEPRAKRLLTQRTVALAAVFIRKVPDQQRGMILVPLSHLAIDDRCLLAIDRRGVAVIVTGAMQDAPPFGPHTQDLGVFLRTPR